MKKNTYTLNTLLAMVLGATLLAAVLVRTFAPRIIIAELDIPNMVLISLVTLVLDHYLAPDAKRCYVCIPVFSAITFGLLPFAACFVGAVEALKLAVSGGMDNPLCIDGHRCSPSGCGKTGSKTKCSVEYICNSAGCEFFLESYFLSCTGLWLCVFVADDPLGSYHRDDRVLSEGG